MAVDTPHANDANDASAAGALLAAARQEKRRISLPLRLRPTNAREAYAIQDAIGHRLAQARVPPPGWKVGAPDTATEPNAAPIFEVVRSPARIAASRMHMIGVEAEIAVVFGQSLAPRATAYGDAEVFGAVRELCVAIEVCDSRLDDWQSAGADTRLADHQLNFALVLGEATDRWRELDFGKLTVRTTVDGDVIKEGTGCHAVGNPLGLIPWLVNHARLRGGIAADAAVTTGAWLGMHCVAPGAAVLVEFDGIGCARVCFPV